MLLLGGMSQSGSREGVKIKLRLCAGGFTCSVQSTLQNAKNEPPRGSGGMPPRKYLKNACSEIESGASETQNCYAKDRLWKSAVREISLEVDLLLY